MKEKRILPKWCKEAKIEMIRQDISTPELADMIHLSREHISGVLNGRIYSEKSIRRICEVLGIDKPEEKVAQNYSQ